MRSVVGWFVVALLVAGCGGDDAGTTEVDEAATSTTGDDVAGITSEDDAGTATAEAPPDAPPPAPASAESCGEPATPLGVGDETSGTAAPGEPVYFCVEVPPGQTEVRFELTGLEDDLDLFVAHDTFETVVEGGLGLQFSDEHGTDPELVTVTPSLYRGELLGFDTYADVTPGPYWIEVVGQASPYTLAVTATPG